MEKVVFALLVAVVAVSGCTTDEIATEQDLQDQTSELKHHTEEQLEEDNDLVRKIHVREIEFSGVCENETDSGFLPDQTVYDRDSGVQEFAGGSYLVSNGFDLDRVWVPDCPRRMELETLNLDSVSFNKTIYQNGSVISSSSEKCDLWSLDGYDSLRVVGEDRWGIEEQLVERGYLIYSECFQIPVNAIESGENR